MEIYDRQNNIILYPSNIGIVGSNIASKIHMIYVWLIIYLYCFVPFDEPTDSTSKEPHKMSEDVKDKSHSEIQSARGHKKCILNRTEDNFTLSFVSIKSVSQL